MESEIHMTEKEVLDVHILERRKFNLLTEVLDLSKQIGESMDRNDQVSLRMLLGMRQEPILKLSKLKEEIAQRLDAFPPEEKKHMREVLAGKTSSNKPEEALMNQALATEKLLSEVIVLDKRINKRIAGDQSIYANEK